MVDRIGNGPGPEPGRRKPDAPGVGKPEGPHGGQPEGLGAGKPEGPGGSRPAAGAGDAAALTGMGRVAAATNVDLLSAAAIEAGLAGLAVPAGEPRGPAEARALLAFVLTGRFDASLDGLAAFQAANGLTATGQPDAATMERLRQAAEARLKGEAATTGVLVARELAKAVAHARLTRRQGEAYGRVAAALAGEDVLARAFWQGWGLEDAGCVTYATPAGRELLSLAAYHLRQEEEPPASRSAHVAALTRRFNGVPSEQA